LEELTNWLDFEGVKYHSSSGLEKLRKQVKETQQQEYNKIETLFEKRGHKVLFLPPYHRELNPIELAWSQVKGMAAIVPAYNLEHLCTVTLPKCFQIFTNQSAARTFRHVETIENALKAHHEIKNPDSKL